MSQATTTCNRIARAVELEDCRKANREFNALYAEWLRLRAELGGPEDLPDITLGELTNRESELVQRMTAVPVEVGFQILQKLEILESYFDRSDWTDQRDLRMLASIRCDLVGLKDKVL